MKRLHLLILRTFSGPFFLIFFIVLFVLLIQFLWRYIDELVGKGLDTKTIGELLLYTSASLVPMALPLSILMSSLMTMGNLGERYELTAIKASGISLQKVLRPLVIVVILLSIGCFFFANNVLPFANLQMRSLLYDIRQQRPELQIKAGEFNNLIDGYSIRVDEKDPKTNTLYGVRIYDHSKGKGNTSVTIADSGTMNLTANEKNFIIKLHNGHSYTEEYNPKKPQKKRTYPHRYDMFKEQQIVIELTGFGLQRTDQSLFKSHYSMLNIEQLKKMEDSLSKEIDNKQEQIFRSLITSNYFKKRDYKKSRAKRSKPAKPVEISPKPSAQKSISVKGTATPLPPESKSHAIKKDSARKEEALAKKDRTKPDNFKIIDIDSLYNTFTMEEQSRVNSAALSYTRTAKNLVANSQQSLEFKIEHLRKYEIEWHRKFTYAFSCFLFMLIGAPLGAIIRKGGLGLPLIISVVFFILHYVLSLIGEKLVRESILLDYQGMWLTSAVFLTIGVFITYKATTDSSIFNMDTYSNFIKKVFGQKYNVVDKVNITKYEEIKIEEAVPVSKLYSNLVDLNDSTEKMLESTKNNFNATDFFVALISTQNDSNLILYERFYYNSFKAIVNHPLFHNKNVRAKTYEFPALNIKEFQDSKTLQYILIIFACIPPFTLIVAARHYIKLIVLRAKLKTIKQLVPELATLLKVADSSNIKNENSSSLQ